MRRTRFVVLAAAVLVVAACARDDGPGATAVSSTSSAAGTTTVATEPGAGGRQRLAGFGEITVTVVAADGERRTFCLMLADVEQLRQRGLMFVEDSALGGYDGMLFVFEEDQSGGFWMKNTRLALSIAWLRADGTTVSTKDMEPCPDSTPQCPTYPAGGAFRRAIEVPKGRLDALGISAGSRVEVGGRACPPA